MTQGEYKRSLIRQLKSTRFVVFSFVGVCIASMVVAVLAAQVAVDAAIRHLMGLGIDIGTITQMYHVILLMAVVSSLSVFGLAVSVLHRLVQPLRDLNQASEAIANGNLKVRVPKRYDDEFGATADAFNLMADKMEEGVEALKRANDTLTNLDKNKSLFVNAVSHELRTPLTSVFGYTEFLEEELAGPLTEQQREFVARIKLSVNTITRMVDDLLDYARMQAGTFQLRPEPADLRQRVLESIGTMQPMADLRDVKLNVIMPEGEVELTIDTTRIGQVLNNLLGNAIKFSPDHDVIDVHLCTNTGKVAVCVVDHGPGLTEEDTAKLFKQFSQTEQGRKAGGTGLGLSIAKQIVEAHGGHIGVKSAPGVGSTFWFDLPVQESVDLRETT